MRPENIVATIAIRIEVNKIDLKLKKYRFSFVLDIRVNFLFAHALGEYFEVLLVAGINLFHCAVAP